MIHVYNDLPIKNTQRYGMCIKMLGGRLTPKAYAEGKKPCLSGAAIQAR